MKLNVSVNDKPCCFEITPDDILLDVLRREGYKGTKQGCREGTCGACIILWNNLPVNSCLLLAARCEGGNILTVEGIGKPGNLHPLQQAMIEEGAVQCGFCTPGMIMSSYALLTENPNPSDSDIEESLSGNLCRCTAYVKYISAVKKVTRK